MAVDTGDCVVFLRAVHDSIHNAAKLRPFFSQFGEVTGVRLQKNGSAKLRGSVSTKSPRPHPAVPPPGNAVVCFSTASAAQLVLSLYALTPERLLLDGRRVRIENNRSFSRPQSFFRRGANAYVAAKLAEKKDVGAGEKLRRDCKSILNKLAPFRS